MIPRKTLSLKWQLAHTSYGHQRFGWLKRRYFVIYRYFSNIEHRSWFARFMVKGLSR